MAMTNEQKMTKLLEELGGLLRAKDEAISSKDWQIKSLNNSNDVLQAEVARLEEENKLLEDALKEAEAELDKYKGGADPYVD